MSKLTNFLKLFKWDTSSNEDLNSDFNIDKALNENFDKIDNFALNCKNDSANAIKQELVKVKETQIYSTGVNLQNVEIFGESTQETREGYNLLKYPYASKFTDTIFTDNGDGTIKLNGTLEANTSKYFVRNYFVKAGTYTFVTGLGKNINLPNTCYFLIKKSTETGYIVQGARKDTEFTLDTDSNIDISMIFIAGSYNNVLLKPMLILGTEEKEYEQYGAMPSVEYPSSIESIKFVNYKATGKNIFDGEMELGSINWANGEFEDNANCIRSKNYTEVKPGQYYAFSNSRNYTHNVYCYDKDNKFIKAESVLNNTSYQIPTNTKYIRFRTTQGTVENNLDTLFQIEIGNTATNYEPYKETNTTIELPENTELCSLENGVEDYIDFDGVIHKKITKIPLGSQNWSVYPSEANTDKYYCFTNDIDNLVKLYSSANSYNLCNVAKSINMLLTSTIADTDVFCIGYTGTSRLRFMLKKEYIDNQEGDTLSAKLNNLFISKNAYILAESTEETTQSLGETEKEKLQNLTTFTGVNNITSNAPLSAIYNTDTKSYIDSKFNALAEQVLNIVGGN